MKTWIGVLVALWSNLAVMAGTPYEAEVEAWRAERVARLTAPDGWLALVGLHFLSPGGNTIGVAKDNAVVLTKGPAHVGTVTVSADGGVSIVFAPGVEASVDGRRESRAVLEWRDAAKPSVVTAGTMSFFVIERGGKKALRVKDSAAVRRAEFAGLDYFPIDPTWRIEARWVAFEKSRMIPITNRLGQTETALAPGKVVFERDGQRYELLPIDEGPDQPLFFVISDATSGKDTYAGGRFVYAAPPRDGVVVLDFNRAENPPCAFTPFATCPLPPKGNRLPFAIRAGERNHRGSHE